MLENKKQVNLRIAEDTVSLLDRAAYVLRKRRSQVVEEAIQEYARNHGLFERYQLNAKNGMLILLKLNGEGAQVVHTEIQNGIPPEDVARKYALMFKQDVILVKE